MGKLTYILAGMMSLPFAIGDCRPKGEPLEKVVVHATVINETYTPLISHGGCDGRTTESEYRVLVNTYLGKKIVRVEDRCHTETTGWGDVSETKKEDIDTLVTKGTKLRIRVPKRDLKKGIYRICGDDIIGNE